MHSERWTPPLDPDPRVILQEARTDALTGRDEVALAKLVWFHECALDYNPHLSGVRLTFALAYWIELAWRYPPAMVKLREARDAARSNVLAGSNQARSFQDLVAMNARLGDTAETVDLFRALHAQNPQAAREVRHYAQAALIQAKEYRFLGQFLSPAEDFAAMRELFQLEQQLSEEAGDKSHSDSAHLVFTTSVATLVALLVLNDRLGEAEEIVAAARAEFIDDEFDGLLAASLQGVVPLI